jgi:hypothetical protein
VALGLQVLEDGAELTWNDNFSRASPLIEVEAKCVHDPRRRRALSYRDKKRREWRDGGSCLV